MIKENNVREYRFNLYGNTKRNSGKHKTKLIIAKHFRIPIRFKPQFK